jgi:hypothetical protein
MEPGNREPEIVDRARSESARGVFLIFPFTIHPAPFLPAPGLAMLLTALPFAATLFVAYANGANAATYRVAISLTIPFYGALRGIVALLIVGEALNVELGLLAVAIAMAIGAAIHFLLGPFN